MKPPILSASFAFRTVRGVATVTWEAARKQTRCEVATPDGRRSMLLGKQSGLSRAKAHGIVLGHLAMIQDREAAEAAAARDARLDERRVATAARHGIDVIA